MLNSCCIPVRCYNKPTTIKQLTLLYSDLDRRTEIKLRLANIPSIIQMNNYNFEYEMPDVVVEEYTQHTNSNMKYCHSLVFSKALLYDELNFWRIFKLGYLCVHNTPTWY